ncbi:MAG TPA: hypothetical protein V6C97_04280 [Oculatellaceae cyanobacterium]
MFGNWTAEELRQAAGKHEALAKSYRDAAALLDSISTKAPIERRRPDSRRARELFSFLQNVDSMTAEDIRSASGIPLATIYNVFQKHPNIFQKDEKNKWTIKPEKRS